MHSQSHRPPPGRKVKEEEYYLFGETSSYPTTIAFAPPPPPPRPLDGLERSLPPPFLTKTYDIVDDPSTDPVVSWNSGSNGLVVWDAHAFSAMLLPKYFKHNNFSSFIRQLNTYGFRKVDPDRWEFANECFLRGQKHLLKSIKRRKTPGSSSSTSVLDNQQSPDPCVEVRSFGLDGEINKLKRDKQVLMSELVKLRQQQQNSRTYLQDMEKRLKKIRSKQHQMMRFLARAVRNPGFLRQLVERSDKRRGIDEALGRKKQWQTIDQAPGGLNLCEAPDFEVTEVEMLDGVEGPMGSSHDRGNGFMDDQTRNIQQKQYQQQGIWENFMDGRGEEELGLDVAQFEDENVLIDGLGDYDVANLDDIYGGSQ
ncbi:hypothetical protein MLD38_039597 [Melastoma candidum]|uniref:Uncharacterized protein n=1 Tax=Melastoma candidum TaxID=119954 RepID=A0ACB9L4Y1_9MYRT|nr:hypothetical protein MLD38_039597 [Melastoma candidum]